MKKIFSSLVLTVIASLPIAAANAEPNLSAPEKVAAAAPSTMRELPVTLVVRYKQNGGVEVFHSKTKIPAGVAVDLSRIRFEPVTHSTAPRRSMDSASYWGNWYFYWNYSYPSYGYGYGYPYNYPAYYYGYNNYYYQPYYNYYSYPYYYRYYGWGY